MRNSLRYKIGFSFVLAALVPLLSILIVSAYIVRNNIHDMVEENLSSLAVEIGIEIERTINDVLTHLNALTENPVLKSSDTSPDEKLREMNRVKDFYKLFEDITLIGTDGVAAASTDYDYRGDWHKKKWFQEALKGKTVISPVHAILYPFRMVFVITVPVYDAAGTIQAVLAGQVNMSKISDIIERVHIGDSGMVFLVDRNGNQIVHPEKEQLLRKVSPSWFRNRIISGVPGFEEYTADDRKRKICHFSILGGYDEYRGEGWRLVMTLDRSEAYTLLRRITVGIVLLGTGGLSLILLLSVLVSYRITKPVKLLVDATQRISKGNLDTKVPVTGDDEIAELQGAFNAMASELQNTTVSRDYVNNILEAMHDALIVMDPEGLIMTVNKEATELLDYDEGELVGKPIETIFLSAKDMPFTRKNHDNTFEGKEIDAYEAAFKTKNGNELAVLFSCSVLRDEYEGVICHVCTAKDISERIEVLQSLRESEEKYRNVVENANEAILVAQDGIIKFVNDKTADISGYSKKEILLKPFTFMIHPDDKNLVMERYAKRLQGEKLPNIYPFRIISKKGVIRWVEINAVLITWEGKPASLNFVSDITELKLAEEALEASELNYLTVFNNVNDAILYMK